MPEPFRLRTRIRSHLPWFLIDLGLCSKGDDCEKAGGSHEWYNQDGLRSACYHCEVIREGRLWDHPGSDIAKSVVGTQSTGTQAEAAPSDL